MLQRLISVPIVLDPRKRVLIHPQYPELKHPLFPRTKLLACPLSGNAWKAEVFRATLPLSSSLLGDQPPGSHNSSSIPGVKTSALPADKTAGLSLIRQRLESRGIQGNSASVILSAWRSATRKSYETYFRKWIHFCRGRQIDYLCPTEYVLLEFLTGLFEAGASYSSLNSARSAVASILVDQQTSIGEAPLIKKFLRGAFNARPQLPRYTSTWDVNIVLNYLRGVAPSKSLSLKQLTLKTAALLLLLSSHRGQTIMNFKLGSKMEL